MRRLRKLTAAMAAMATTMKSIMIKNIFLAQLTDLLDLLAHGTPVHAVSLLTQAVRLCCAETTPTDVSCPSLASGWANVREH